jgi:hypothetical protein
MRCILAKRTYEVISQKKQGQFLPNTKFREC